jgi:hypothetical protein
LVQPSVAEGLITTKGTDRAEYVAKKTAERPVSGSLGITINRLQGYTEQNDNVRNFFRHFPPN